MAGGARRMGERVLAYAGHVAEKARYGGIPRLFVDGLDLLGVTIRPFYVYQEGAVFHDGPVAVPAGYEIGHLGAADMPEVAAIPNLHERVLRLPFTHPSTPASRTTDWR